MAKKQEERDWSEIIAEVRSKAQSEIKDAIEDIRPKVEALVEKVRNANFNDEAEEFLAKLKKMADEFSQSEDGPTKAKGTSSASKGPLYIEPDGTEHGRKGKWSEKYTEAQLAKMKQR